MMTYLLRDYEVFNGAKEHETININLSNKPIWISDLNVDRKVPILEFIDDGEKKVWLKFKYGSEDSPVRPGPSSFLLSRFCQWEL